MKFCQTDGTLLIDDAPPADPYKTVVGNQSDIAAAIPPVDPFKTMVASSPQPRDKEEDVLQLPDKPDAQKMTPAPQDESRRDLNSGRAEDVPALDLPLPPSAPLIEPKPSSQTDYSAPAQFNKPPLRPPVFGNLSSSETGADEAVTRINQDFSRENPSSSPFDSKPFQNDFSGQSPYGNQENKPIPSPFQDSSSPEYQSPAASPFDPPKPPPFNEVEPMFGGQPESFGNAPFQPPSPFGSGEQPFKQPMQQTEWTPPPAPVAEWQNQDLGANTPFQPPATGGQDQTLAIVSLVCGILSIVCCGAIAGIPAIITGFMAKNNVDSNPNQYGGRGFALAGMILGGISVFFTIIYILYIVFFGFSRGF
jgi:hypothetical protein